MDDKQSEKWFRSRILRRFTEYVRIDTTSRRNSAERPTSAGQILFAEQLKAELDEIGLASELAKDCFLIASLPPSQGVDIPTIGFMAHMDTSEDVSGTDVVPQIHDNYDGRAIRLAEDVILDPKDFPDLLRFIGDTIVTASGQTLLGADDKAGVAEIMTAAEYLVLHPEISHGPIELIFTPDEETGLGMDRFPLDRIKSRRCYTLDGGEDPTIEAECFEAYRADFTFFGRSMHLGKARGKLANAVEMAGCLLSLLPKVESPQATDERFGYYCPLEIQGSLEQAKLAVFIRDFEEDECLRRLGSLKKMADAVEASYPGGRVEMTSKKQYSNMRRFLKKSPEVLKTLEAAIREVAGEPLYRTIRGGTDGARLCELGIPTPNMFTGGYNYHSRLEWSALSSMAKASQVVVALARIWAEKSE
jgi:tripeptide aminopeptidase